MSYLGYPLGSNSFPAGAPRYLLELNAHLSAPLLRELYISCIFVAPVGSGAQARLGTSRDEPRALPSDGSLGPK